MDEGGSLENCSPEESGPWVRILLPPPNQNKSFNFILTSGTRLRDRFKPAFGEVAERLKAVGC